uniref:Secreted protein n=1 Tax=Brugia timori TaxID=42155 RepID=A0A0R3QHU1_9BILA
MNIVTNKLLTKPNILTSISIFHILLHHLLLFLFRSDDVIFIRHFIRRRIDNQDSLGFCELLRWLLRYTACYSRCGCSCRWCCGWCCSCSNLH